MHPNSGMLSKEGYLAYIIEAFSWGNDLVSPDIKKYSEPNLDVAKDEQAVEIPKMLPCAGS